MEHVSKECLQQVFGWRKPASGVDAALVCTIFPSGVSVNKGARIWVSVLHPRPARPPRFWRQNLTANYFKNIYFGASGENLYVFLGFYANSLWFSIHVLLKFPLTILQKSWWFFKKMTILPKKLTFLRKKLTVLQNSALKSSVYFSKVYVLKRKKNTGVLRQ